MWKSIDGMKDVAFQYSGRYEENISLTSHGDDVVQANCIRCHGATVEMIDTTRKCWECHRRLIHRRSGAMRNRVIRTAKRGAADQEISKR